jgi:succinoglycan biosynthesis transport protein ExoP
MNSDNSSATPVAAGSQATQAQQFIAPAADTTLSESLITLRKRRLVVIACVLAGIAVGLYQALTQVKLYTAYGRIQVRTGSSNEFKLSAVGALGDDPQRKMLTEVAILTSDTLLTTVARDLNLANDPTFLQAKGPVAHRNLDDPSVRFGVVRLLKANLDITLVPKTDIIRIGYSSIDPRLSTKIVNTLIDDYIQRSYQTRFDSTQRVSRWLSNQLDDLKEQVESSQDQLLDLQKRLGVLGFDSQHNEIAASLEDLAKAQGTAKLARILAEARYRLLMGMDPDSIESEIDSTPGQPQAALTSMRTSLATARAQLAQSMATLGPNHPTVKSAKAQVEALQKEVDTEQNRLLTQAKENFLLTKANEEQTTAALEQQKAEAYRLRDDLVEYTILQREFESKSKLYEALTEKLRTAGVEAGLESLEIDVVDRAVMPVTPAGTPRSTTVLTWAALGLVAGVLLAFLLESLDTGLRSIAEIESVTELPSLAIVPRARRSTPEQIAAMTTVERNVNVLTQPKSQFTEAFRSLRTALLLSTVGREPKYILFTSATPSEGKTTTASNLAVILSQRGTRVLLIDADLRRPNIHHRFGLNGKLGLSTVLSGQTKLEDSVQTVREVPGLDILASGPVPPFPTEMLSSETMSDLLRHAGEIYTHVVIDSPPILSVTDGVLLSRQVDAVVLVVRHAKSSKHIVRRGRDLLVRSGAPLAGIVLNAVDLNAPEYYGYYGYTGYSYSSLDPAGWDAQSGSSKSGQKKDSR